MQQAVHNCYFNFVVFEVQPIQSDMIRIGNGVSEGIRKLYEHQKKAKLMNLLHVMTMN